MSDWSSLSSKNQSDPERSSPHVSVSTWGLCLRRGGFATFQLGASGWLALLSPGAVLGLLVARLTDGSFVIWGVAGALAVWLIAVGIERTFAGHRATAFHITPALNDAQFEGVAEAARYAGIKFEHMRRGDVDEGEVADERLGSEDVGASVFSTKAKYRARLQNIIFLTTSEAEDR